MEAFQAICDAGSCTNSESDVNEWAWLFWLGSAEQTEVCPWFLPILPTPNVKYSVVPRD